MNTKNNRKYQETQLKINHTFLALLDEREFDTITISDICKEANITRATFYAHCASTTELLKDVEEEMSQEAIEQLYVGGDFQTTNCFVILFEYISRHQRFYQVYLHNYWRMPLFELTTENISGMDVRRLADIIGIQDEHELYYHQSFFQAGINSLVRIWLADGCKDSPEYMAGLISKQYHFDSVLKELSDKHKAKLIDT